MKRPVKPDERTKELAASVRRKIAESKEKRKPPHFTAEEWALIQQGEFYPCKPEIFEQTYEPATRPRPDAGGEEGVGHRISFFDEFLASLTQSQEEER